MKKNIKKILSLFMAIAIVLSASVFYSWPVVAESTVPVYRLHNAKTGRHLYTTDENEIVSLTKNGWTKEGIAWQAPLSGTPVYRLSNAKGQHLYTSDQKEISVLTSKHGWKMDNNNVPMFNSGGDRGIYRLYNAKTGNHLLSGNEKECETLKKAGWKNEGVTLNAVGNTAASNAPAASPTVQNSEYIRGVWISFLEWQENLKGKNEADFRKEFTKMCDTTVANNLNTVFVHVRSHNDAVYPSSIYPWSTEMLEGIPSYDPLAIMVDIAHSKGLSFHAWINPYGYRNGEFAGDPALITKDYIVSGVKEVLDKYNVDGIHFDDYFPPYDKSVHNELIYEVYKLVHAYGKVFGISPQGNLSNNRKAGVDVDTWLSLPSYVDYLAPQIYWTDQYGEDGKTQMFTERLEEWTKINKLNIPMYVGLALYRSDNSYTSDPGWKLRSDNLATQIQKANAAGWDGFIHFRYAFLLEDATQKELSNIK